MRFQNRTIRAVSLAILLSFVALIFMTADQRYVAAPGLACIVMVLWLWTSLWDRDRKIPFYDAGMFCGLATLIYTVYPLFNYWMGGLQFGPLSDFRLESHHILPNELGIFYLRHVLYLFCFVAFYSIFRDRGNVKTGNVPNPSRSRRDVILIIFLLLIAYFFLLQVIKGVNYNSSYEPEAYANRTAALFGLPLILLQISSKLWGILFLFKIGLLFIVVRQYEKIGWRIFLFVWIAAEFIQALAVRGARTGFILFLIATALLYHRLVKPLTMKFLFFSGTILLVLFFFLGLYRSYYTFEEMRGELSQGSDYFTMRNEFQTLLGTAYDVQQRKEAGAYLPWYLYINDFISILPPQQFVPFEKVPASEWYLREVGLSGTGVGLMWGVISQSIIGLDWLELAIRGAILGFILARFHRWYIKRQSGFLETVFYTFICLKVYYTFRDTTFSLLANIVWEIIPFYIVLRIWEIIPSRKVGHPPDRRIALPAP